MTPTSPARTSTAIVDKLLASPQFGERWGRHWLDVARYAESTGKDSNMTYPDAWRYRDYVIAAFNADKPYDQFIREQLAGDLLPATSTPQKAEYPDRHRLPRRSGPKSLDRAQSLPPASPSTSRQRTGRHTTAGIHGSPHRLLLAAAMRSSSSIPICSATSMAWPASSSPPEPNSAPSPATRNNQDSDLIELSPASAKEPVVKEQPHPHRDRA